VCGKWSGVEYGRWQECKESVYVKQAN